MGTFGLEIASKGLRPVICLSNMLKIYLAIYYSVNDQNWVHNGFRVVGKRLMRFKGEKSRGHIKGRTLT